MSTNDIIYLFEADKSIQKLNVKEEKFW